jgi:hypothetical protein
MNKEGILLDRETLKSTIELIIKQNERDERFNNAMKEFIGQGIYVIPENFCYEALIKLLRKQIDPYDYIEWWLYEPVEKIVTEKDGTKHDLTTLDSLCDYLIKNKD